jgi:hypothetical protein
MFLNNPNWWRIILSPHATSFERLIEMVTKLVTLERWVLVHVNKKRNKEYKVTLHTCSISLINECKNLFYNSWRNNFYVLLSTKLNDDDLIHFLKELDWNNIESASFIQSKLLCHATIGMLGLSHIPPYAIGVAIYVSTSAFVTMNSTPFINNCDRLCALTSVFQNTRLVDPKLIITPFTEATAEMFNGVLEFIGSKGLYIVTLEPQFWEYPISIFGSKNFGGFNKTDISLCQLSFVSIDGTDLSLYHTKDFSIVKKILFASIVTHNILYFLPAEVSFDDIQCILKKYEKDTLWGCKQLLNFTPWLIICNIISEDSPSLAFISFGYCGYVYGKLKKNLINNIWTG